MLAQNDKLRRVGAPNNSGGSAQADHNDGIDVDSEKGGNEAGRHGDNGDDNDVENDSRASVQDDKSQRSGAAARKDAVAVDRNTDSSFDKLKAEIATQRHLLRPDEVEGFDDAWGVDPTGEFVLREEGRGLFRRHMKVWGRDSSRCYVQVHV